MRDVVVTTKRQTGIENTEVTEEFLGGFRYDGGDKWFKIIQGSAGGEDGKAVTTEQVKFSQVPLHIRVHVYKRYERDQSIMVKSSR